MAVNQLLKDAIDNAIEQQKQGNKADRDSTYFLAMLMMAATISDDTDELEQLQQDTVTALNTLHVDLTSLIQVVTNIYSRQLSVQQAIQSTITSSTNTIVDKLQELIDKP